LVEMEHKNLDGRMTYHSAGKSSTQHVDSEPIFPNEGLGHSTEARVWNCVRSKDRRGAS
jgi:hypothetical protein